MKSIAGLEDKKDLAFLYKRNDAKNRESDNDDEEGKVSEKEQAREREIA